MGDDDIVQMEYLPNFMKPRKFIEFISHDHFHLEKQRQEFLNLHELFSRMQY